VGLEPTLYRLEVRDESISGNSLKRAVISALRSTKTRTKIKLSIPHLFDKF
jgi:hypothetical protein